MSTCARCGLSKDGRLGSCSAGLGSAIGDLTCRDRELSNLRALLRSVTISLEQAAGYCESGHAAEAAKVLDGVLERLS